MLVLTRQKWQIRLATVYFLDAPLSSLTADIAILRQSKHPVGDCTEFSTLHIDLTRDEGDLFDGCAKSNRYKIRRASSRDALVFEPAQQTTKKNLADFITFFDQFAANRGLPLSDKPLLKALHAADALRISRVLTADGEILCKHLHITGSHRARLLHSASHFRDIEDSSIRALIGRANRALHWMDLKSFKEDGFEVYDFGGFSLDSADPVIRQISQFKASFGGSCVLEYHSIVPLTLKGKVGLWGHRVLRREAPQNAM